MIDGFLSRMANTRGFLTKLWALSRPYWFAEDWQIVRIGPWTLRLRERWIARALLLTIVALSVFVVYVSKLLNEWNSRFFNALQEKNAGAFWHELKYWAAIVAIYIVVAVYRLWLRQLLTIRWRRWLSEVYFRDWLADRTYYRMELVNQGTDNPEQRIEQDCNSFTQQTLTLTLDLLSQVMTLVTFVFVLWSLSGSYVLPLFGGIAIPGYMMWVALIYAFLGSTLTYFIGRPLVRTNFMLERYNADFRYRMTRIRENAESIALYQGEANEQGRLRTAFSRIYETWWDFMRFNKRLTWLTAFYSQAASIFPIIVAAPRYFAGEIPLGALTQTAGAFGQVQGSLSWFVDSYATLADWKAILDRLTTFSEAMAKEKQKAETSASFETTKQSANAIDLDHVAVQLPGGTALLEDINLKIAQGEAVVLSGPSGSGKTTLFRVLAGLWPFGSGRIRTPENARVLFLPQKPYLPIGTLREVLSYPQATDAVDEQACRDALEACALPHLVGRLGEAANWSMTLSGGEQQRLAFARALLYRPDWLFLDEATSALDEPTEARMYQLMQQRLPGVTLISIAHKPAVLQFHRRQLVIDPARHQIASQSITTTAN